MSTETTRVAFALGPVRRLTTFGLALIVAGTAGWTSPIALAATAVLRTTFTIRVYQTAGLPSMLEQRALAEAGAALRAARVDVRWRPCTGPAPSPACDVPPDPSELLLVVRDGAPCQDTSATLGNALVIHRAGGVLATVYSNCVAWLAKAASTDVGVLLGRVAAHELGHLMMHTSAHAPRGLMRSNWTPEEIQRDLAADWAFTPGDIAAMRQPGPEH